MGYTVRSAHDALLDKSQVYVQTNGLPESLILSCYPEESGNENYN